MPLYVADYRAKTAHLNAAQHGAYLLLIMHYWSTGSLPDDDKSIARIAAMTPAEWRRSRPTIQAFFHSGWRHGRLDDELSKIQKREEFYQGRARIAAKARWGNGHA